MESKHETFQWTSKDGLKLFAQEWRPDGTPKAVICLVHGMGEHSSRYGHVAEYLTSKGFGFITYDHRGHGQSEGKRGHTPDYAHLLDDVDLLLKKAEERFPNVPQVLYGHSMGGNVVANYILRRSPDILGAILSSPWLRLAFAPPAFRLFLGKIMNKIFPKFTEKSDLKSSDLSRDPEVGKAYDADPLVHRFITARFFFSVHESGEWAIANADKLQIPTYLFHGTADPITSYPASQEFAKKAGNKFLQTKWWEGAYHETHNETNKNEVIAEIGGFVEKLLA